MIGRCFQAASFKAPADNPHECLSFNHCVWVAVACHHPSPLWADHALALHLIWERHLLVHADGRRSHDVVAGRPHLSVDVAGRRSHDAVACRPHLWVDADDRRSHDAVRLVFRCAVCVAHVLGEIRVFPAPLFQPEHRPLWVS